MNNKKSCTQLQYEMAYRDLRRGIDKVTLFEVSGIPNGMVQAADYSDRMRNYRPNGWVSNLRRARFIYRKNYVVQTPELPF